MLYNYKKSQYKDDTCTDLEEVIFEKNNLLKIFRHKNGNYGFEIGNKVFTSDIMEAVAYIMKHPNLISEDIWNLPIVIDEDISTISALYWLSGGDLFWNNPNNVDLYSEWTWNNKFQIYMEEFGDKLLSALKSSKTFGDLRNCIQYDFNLDIFYEFALQNGMI